MNRESRRWLEIAARSPSVDADVVIADALVALGGRAVVEQDGWQVTHIAEPEETEGLAELVHHQLVSITGLSDVEARIGWQDHQDWAESWKRGLAPRRITKRLVVRPSWTEFEPNEGDLVIVLDPGMAFGTAEHGTTRGCLRLLDETVRSGETLLDVGAGSGILAVAAAMLGAAQVLAVEGDALACEALEENVGNNRVRDRVRWLVEWADGGKLAQWGPVDGVIANIEAGMLRPLLSGFRAAVVPGGWMILSGILEDEWDGMRAEIEAQGFVFQAVDADGDWRSGLFRLPADS
jgi:ribosomal protein L11 methyltransferase